MPVYGDCLSTNGFEEVSIAHLREAGCDVVFPPGRVPEDRVLTIWIGAIGPITGDAANRHGSTVSLKFHEEIDPRVMRHFACV
jgi:hypothetical protein